MITKKSCEETILLLKSVSFSLGPLLTFSQKSTKRALRQRSQKKNRSSRPKLGGRLSNYFTKTQLPNWLKGIFDWFLQYMAVFSHIWQFKVIFGCFQPYLQYLVGLVKFWLCSKPYSSLKMYLCPKLRAAGVQRDVKSLPCFKSYLVNIWQFSFIAFLSHIFHSILGQMLTWA